MRAVLVEEFGPPSSLVVRTVDDMSPAHGEVVLGVCAASINFPDILVVEGTYQSLPPRPFSPGKEVAGRVLAVGKGVDRLVVGQRVFALVEHGGYAEQVTVPEQNVIELPDEVGFVQAAACGLVYITAHLGLRHRGQVRSGETVLITGAGGGVGSAAVQLARQWGARVVALAQNEAKAELARKQGAHFVLTSTPETLRDDLLEVTSGRGVDLALDVLGGDYFPQVLRATAWEGRVVVVGFASGGQVPIKPGHLLVKNISVIGLQSSDYQQRSFGIARAAMMEVFSLLGSGEIDASIDRTFPLENAGEALQLVRDGNAMGKIVLTTGAV